MDVREGVKSPWIPAFAGMTSDSNSKMDPGFRRDDGQRRKTSLRMDVREGVKSPWIPASAGMTSKSARHRA